MFHRETRLLRFFPGKCFFSSGTVSAPQKNRGRNGLLRPLLQIFGFTVSGGNTPLSLFFRSQTFLEFLPDGSQFFRIFNQLQHRIRQDLGPEDHRPVSRLTFAGGNGNWSRQGQRPPGCRSRAPGASHWQNPWNRYAAGEADSWGPGACGHASSADH